MGSKEIVLGSSYVALSRARNPSFFAFDFDDICNYSSTRWNRIGSVARRQERNQEEERLLALNTVETR